MSAWEERFLHRPHQPQRPCVDAVTVGSVPLPHVLEIDSVADTCSGVNYLDGIVVFAQCVATPARAMP